MTQLLEQLISEIRQMPEPQQDDIAQRMLEAVEDAKWDTLLARPEAQAKLRELAIKARANYKAGLTTPIIPEEMEE